MRSFYHVVYEVFLYQADVYLSILALHRTQFELTLDANERLHLIMTIMTERETIAAVGAA